VSEGRAPADEVVATSRAVMAAHARTFNGAAAFLPADRRDEAAVLYALCREIDDLGDETADREGLERLRAELKGEVAPSALVGAWLEVAERRSIDSEPLLHLIDGVLSDLGEVRMADDGELLRYCYRVAGTVGLLMCGILGVRERWALPHAVDLGLGMQLTNICRDVLEDAERGRVYLPADRLAAVGVSHDQLLAGTADREAVARVVLDLLDVADGYYASASAGMVAIPWRTRWAIRVASRTYHAIGEVLRARGGDALAGRAWVSTPKKAWLVVTELFRRLPSAPHDRSLHTALVGLPGAAA